LPRVAQLGYLDREGVVTLKASMFCWLSWLMGHFLCYWVSWLAGQVAIYITLP